MQVSNLLLVGFGKMGRLTFEHLRKAQKAEHIYIVEPDADRWIIDDNVIFYKDILELPVSKKMDCAFIITPAVTHFEIMKHVISMGIKNIFVEKPAVCSAEELQSIQMLGRDCKIVVGYILRQSGTINDLTNLLSDMQKEGYVLKDINVLYVKDANEEGRLRTDIGVLDEAFHAWDILFNCLNLKRVTKISSGPNRFKQDCIYPDKYIQGKMTYSLLSGNKQTEISMLSSFESPVKKRDFLFRFTHERKAEKKVLLSFDNPDGFDRISVWDNAERPVFFKQYFALEKLKKQIDAVFTYFSSSQKGILHILSDSFVLQQVYHLTNNAIGKKVPYERMEGISLSQKEQKKTTNIIKHTTADIIKNSRRKHVKQKRR